MFNLSRYTPKFNITGGSEIQGIVVLSLSINCSLVLWKGKKLSSHLCHHHRVIFQCYIKYRDFEFDIIIFVIIIVHLYLLPDQKSGHPPLADFQSIKNKLYNGILTLVLKSKRKCSPITDLYRLIIPKNR